MADTIPLWSNPDTSKSALIISTPVEFYFVSVAFKYSERGTRDIQKGRKIHRKRWILKAYIRLYKIQVGEWRGISIKKWLQIKFSGCENIVKRSAYLKEIEGCPFLGTSDLFHNLNSEHLGVVPASYYPFPTQIKYRLTFFRMWVSSRIRNHNAARVLHRDSDVKSWGRIEIVAGKPNSSILWNWYRKDTTQFGHLRFLQLSPKVKMESRRQTTVKKKYLNVYLATV